VKQNQGLQIDGKRIIRGEPRNGLTATVVLVVAIVITLFVLSRVPYASYTTFTLESKILMKSQSILITGKGSFYWEFPLYSNSTNIHISGAFESNESVFLTIMNQNQYGSVSLYGSLATNPLYYLWSSGNTTNGNISITLKAPSEYLPSPQLYYIMFYNPNPPLTSSHYRNVAEVNITSPIVLTFDYENSHYKILI
jgi:hypothetical protein